jgi:hypothetical protein
VSEDKPESYIRRVASRLLTYRDFFDKLKDPYADSDHGPKTVAKIFGEINDLLAKPRFSSDVINTFDELKQLPAIVHMSGSWK